MLIYEYHSTDNGGRDVILKVKDKRRIAPKMYPAIGA
jgi:hypothetical protein